MSRDQAAPGRRGRLSPGDLIAVAGAGSALAFLLGNWWLGALSPVPFLARHGAAGTLAGQLLLGVLLGVRAQRPSRAAALALASVALGVAGLGLVLQAPLPAESPETRALAQTFTASRLAVSALVAAPAGLLGAVLGAALSEPVRGA